MAVETGERNICMLCTACFSDLATEAKGEGWHLLAWVSQNPLELEVVSLTNHEDATECLGMTVKSEDKEKHIQEKEKIYRYRYRCKLSVTSLVNSISVLLYLVRDYTRRHKICEWSFSKDILFLPQG